MGAKKEGGVEGEGEKKEVGSAVSVFEMGLYCEGCAKKVEHAIKRMKGVEKVKADTASNKVTVKGNVDPTQIKARIKEKIKREVEIISPLPKKGAGAGGGDEKAEEKAEKKKPPKERTVYLKIWPYCCCNFHVSKLKKIIKKIEGVNSVEVDEAKKIFIVKGTMETKELVADLTEKLKKLNRYVEKTKKKVQFILPPPEMAAGDGRADKKVEEKAEKKKPPKERTVYLKIWPPYYCCDSHVSELKKIIKKIEGVNSVEVDEAKEIFIVKGTIETKELERDLTKKLEKLERNVEVVSPPPPPPAKKKEDKKLMRNA